MSTSRHGPVLVAKSPTLEHQFASMSISGAASSSSASTSAPAPQPPALSKRVLAYFEEQRKIGAQRQRNPYPMKYDISVYRMADAAIKKCLASVDSSDWRVRELSIRATDAAIDLLDEALRRPIAEESVSVLTNPKRPPISELAKNHFLYKLPYSDVPDFVRPNPPGTRCERNRFPTDRKANTVLLSVPHAKLQEIGLRVLSFVVPGPEQSPGPVLLEDLLYRVWNLSEKMFQPEVTCMEWLAKGSQKPSVVKWNGKSDPLSADSMTTGLACEAARRLIKSGMSPRLVDSLVEKYMREVECMEVRAPVKSTLEKGHTGDSVGALSW